MNTPRISVPQPGEAAPYLRLATISIVRVDHDWVPDLDPGGAPDMTTAMERGLIRLQKVMGRAKERNLDEVRAALDHPPGRARKALGMRLRNAEPSDVSLAAVLLHPGSPFALHYRWEPGAVACWPDGMTWVFYQGHTRGDDLWVVRG